MFERFTDKARLAVVVAQEEVRELKQGFVGTEHLLLGVLKTESHTAEVLSEWLTYEDVKARLDVGSAELGGHLPFHPELKHVFELSLREALQFAHNWIGTEHLVGGLLRGKGLGESLLHEHIGLEEWRKHVAKHYYAISPLKETRELSTLVEDARRLYEALKRMDGDIQERSV